MRCKLHHAPRRHQTRVALHQTGNLIEALRYIPRAGRVSEQASAPHKHAGAAQLPLHFAGQMMHPHRHYRSILPQPPERCCTTAAAAAALTAAERPPATCIAPPLPVTPRAAAPAVMTLLSLPAPAALPASAAAANIPSTPVSATAPLPASAAAAGISLLSLPAAASAPAAATTPQTVGCPLLLLLVSTGCERDICCCCSRRVSPPDALHRFVHGPQEQAPAKQLCSTGRMLGVFSLQPL